MVVPTLPAGHNYAHKRTRDEVRVLRTAGHEVVVCSLEDEGKTFQAAPHLNASFLRWCEQVGVPVILPTLHVQEMSGPERTRWALIAARNEMPEPDSVVSNYWTSAEQCLDIIRQLFKNSVVAIDTVDFHARRLRYANNLERRNGGVGSIDWKASMRRELMTYMAADRIIAVTELEAKKLHALMRYISTDNQTEVCVVGQVVGTVSSPHDVLDRSKMVLFGGHFNHRPNIDSVRWWAHEIGPKLSELNGNGKLFVCGEDPQGELAGLARLSEFIDQAPPHLTFSDYLPSARVAVAPMRVGAGINGKLTEALGSGVPVVCTPLTAHNAGLERGHHAFVARTPDDFAQAVYTLLTDDLTWREMSDAGRAWAALNLNDVRMLAGLEQAIAPYDFDNRCIGQVLEASL